MSEIVETPEWVLANASPLDGEWLETRRKGITGTEIGALLGMNPWATEHDIWRDKVGEGEPITETMAMYWGKRLEPVIAKELATRLERPVIRNGNQCFQSRSLPLVTGTPDAFLEDFGELGPEGGEIKNVFQFGRKNWGEPGSDEVPEHYSLQSQWYMLLTGATKMYFPVLFGGNNFLIYEVNADAELQEMMYEKADEWWEYHVVGGNEPIITYSEATESWLKGKFSHKTEILVPAEYEQIQQAIRYEEIKAAMKALKDEQQDLKVKLQRAIGDDEGLELPDKQGKVTWKKNKDGSSTNYKGIVESCLGTKKHVTKKLVEANTSKTEGARVLRTNIKLESNEEE